MKEEEKKAIETFNNYINAIETFGTIDPKCCNNLYEPAIALLDLIETQKAELEKKDKIIDLMIDTILKNDDNYWYLFDANKKAIEEYFTKLVEGGK